MSESPTQCPVCEGPMKDWESTGLSVDWVRKLVRDAYDEGYGLALNSRHSRIHIPFEESAAFDELQALGEEQ